MRFSVNIVPLFTCSSTCFSQMRTWVRDALAAGSVRSVNVGSESIAFPGLCLRVHPILIRPSDVLTNLSSSLGELAGGLPRVCVVVNVAGQVVTSSFELRRPWRLITLLTMPPRALARRTTLALAATHIGLSWGA
jgi:hypothetical protein